MASNLNIAARRSAGQKLTNVVDVFTLKTIRQEVADNPPDGFIVEGRLLIPAAMAGSTEQWTRYSRSAWLCAANARLADLTDICTNMAKLVHRGKWDPDARWTRCPEFVERVPGEPDYHQLDWLKARETTLEERELALTYVDHYLIAAHLRAKYPARYR